MINNSLYFTLLYFTLHSGARVYIPKLNVNGQHYVHVIVAPMVHHPSSPSFLTTPAKFTVFLSEVLCTQFVTSTLTTIFGLIESLNLLISHSINFDDHL